MTTAQTQDLDVQPTPLALLLLGREADPRSERGVECPGDLPSPSDPDLVERARAAKEKLGDKVFVLGHHYQRDEVIQFADVTGDSFKLARDAAARPEAEYIVFCGVHFMAESADILTGDDQKVVLPDLAAGCSMADMATAEQVAECWDVLTEAGVADQVVPVSYMNSSADIKAFTGQARRHDLHLVQRRAGPGVGLRAGREGAVPAGPAPGPQHGRTGHGDVARGLRPLQPAQAERRPDRRAAARREDDPVARATARCTAASRVDSVERRPRADPRRQRPGPPGVQARGRGGGGPRRLDRVHHQGAGGGPGRLQVGHRHGAEPGAPAGEPFRRPRTRRSSSSTRRSASARR